MVAGAYWTVGELRDALARQDAAKLDQHVDFPALRADLKTQLRELLVSRSQVARRDDRLGELAVGIATVMVGGMVERFVTPQGLAGLSSGDGSRKPFAEARRVWEAHDRFVVYVPASNGQEAAFVLARDALRWRLVAVRLPVQPAAAGEVR